VRIVLLGPPGAGKGTQAKRLAKRYGLAHIATGDIFRRNIQDGTELGVLAKRYLDAGELVPDQVTVDLVTDALDEQRGFILDGFPRTIAQAEALERALADRGIPLDVALAFSLDEDLAVRRIAGRRSCSRCGHPYNVYLDPPRVPDACDDCGGPLVQRSDDDEATVRRRIEVYHESTAPLLDFYARRGLLRAIDADGTEDEVMRRAEGALGGAIQRVGDSGR
jgi:adenylate kinase